MTKVFHRMPKQTLPIAVAGEGIEIVDSTGKTIRLTGINWFGLDTADLSLHGLWAHGMNWYLDNVVVKYGFNCIRVPFSSAMLDNPSAHIHDDLVTLWAFGIATVGAAALAPQRVVGPFLRLRSARAFDPDEIPVGHVRRPNSFVL